MKAELGVPFMVDVPGEVKASTDTIAVARVENGKAVVIPLDLGKVEAALVTADGRSIPLALEVSEPATMAKTQEPADIKPPFAARPNPVPWLLLVLALAAAALLWRLLRKRAPGAAAAAPRPLLPPEEEALAALEGLRSARGVPLYAGITEALRRYAERRWGVNAASLTTSELARLLRRMDVPAAGLKRLFERADLVKFAKLPADEAWAEADLDEARRFVRETAPVQSLKVGS